MQVVECFISKYNITKKKKAKFIYYNMKIKIIIQREHDLL
jgi:hypothetical protein